MAKDFRKRLWIQAAILIVFLDQLTKYLVRASFQEGESISLIPGLLNLTYATNTGAGFSILRDQNTLLLMIAVILVSVIIYFFQKADEKYKPFLMMIIAGTIGNITDRVFLGHVTDFIQVGFFPVFNVADSAITIGALGMIYLLFTDKNAK